MIQRILTVLVIAALLVVLVTISAFSKASFDHRGRIQHDLSNNVTQYNFSKIRSKPVAWGDLMSPSDDPMAGTPFPRSSLGAVQSPSGVASPGFVVKNSYNDDQMFPGGNRQVDFRTTPSIQFVYGSAASTTQPGKFGYNVYDPTGGGSWPRGPQLGCDVQASDGEGWWDNMDVTPAGYVVIGGDDDATGSLDNHFFWQSSQHSCFWNAGSQIASSQYSVNFFTSTNYLAQIRIEVQEVGTDTVTHVIAVESAPTTISGAIAENTLNYFRKVGGGQGGTWTGPITLDSINRSSGSQAVSGGAISASRVSNKVLVSYTHFHDSAYTQDQRYDVEVYKRVSTDGGLTWGPATNISNYSRVLPSQSAFINTHALIDSEDGEHVIWTANTTVANVYQNTTYFWGDFSANLYHWTDRIAGPNAGGTIVKAHDSNWGIDVNTQVCGFPSPGLSYIGYESIAECNGRIYLFASQYNDYYGLWGQGSYLDDCASGFSDRLFAANGELFMTVSTSLDGILWDAARNLTKTRTVDCDSAGFGGVCMNDGRATVSRYGYDSASFGQELTFPGAELVIPDNGVWTGGNYLHVFYTEDHYPAPGWRDPDTYNQITLNPLKWMRIPCVDPISAAQILTSITDTGYPAYVTHTSADTIPVTVTNDGNVGLTVSSIAKVQTSGPAGWLSVTASTMAVGAGINNTGSFDIIIDGTVVGAPGTIVELLGEVYLLSDAANNDSASIFISYVAADTVIGLVWDTVTTSLTRLVVSNTGEMGGNGDGTLNLDYVNNGAECNISTTDPNTEVFLYSGGPIVVRDNGAGNFDLNHSMHQQDFATDVSFRRSQIGQSSNHISTDPAYDGFFSGTMYNIDTTIGVERTYFAPTTGTGIGNFVVVRTDIFSADGNPQNGLALGEAIDWDIPATEGSDNISGAMTAYNTVYQRGVDTGAVACQSNTARYGSAQLLGFYTSSEFNADACANTCVPHGSYTLRNDTLFDIDDTLLAAWYWDKMGTRTGVTSEPDDSTDLHQVLTVVHNYNLAVTDTFTFYHVVASVKDGTVSDMETTLDNAFAWWNTNMRPSCASLCGCCQGITGNVDGDPGEIVDIGDLTALIGFLFIPPNTPPSCMEEANTDGDAGGVVDIGDLTALIGFLFIPPNTPPAACQ